MANIDQIISELYQSQYARLLAVLTRLFGIENLNLAEDVLQDTFGKAIAHWKNNGIPPNPEAWLTQTAKNGAIDIIRSNNNRGRLANDLSHFLDNEWSLQATVETEFTEEHIKDDQLKMMFMCCNNDLSKANQLPLILRLLCGLSIVAISRALLTPEQTIKKRLQRAKAQLKQSQFILPSNEDILASLDTVHTALYLVFNEGFHSSENSKVMNVLLCEEAIDLVNLLVDSPSIANRETLSLFALMHFHIARAKTRIDTTGNSIPLDLQDRENWELKYIHTGNTMLSLAERFESESAGRFFYEAVVAQEHCAAKDFGSTNWKVIINAYDELIKITESPVAKINRAIAVAYDANVERAIADLEALKDTNAFKNSHLPDASLAHCYAMLGQRDKSLALAKVAKLKGGTPAEHQLMQMQLERILSN